MTSPTMTTGNPEIDAQLSEALMAELQENGMEGLKAAPDWYQDSEMGAINGGEPVGLIGDVRTRDRVTVYSTIDGEPRHILIYMLAKVIRKKRADGKPAFSVSQTIPYMEGSMPCMLHESYPDRALWDSIGLRYRTCSMDGIATGMDQQLHMEHRHQQEWKTIVRYREELEKEEERDFRRALLANQPGVTAKK